MVREYIYFSANFQPGNLPDLFACLDSELVENGISQSVETIALKMIDRLEEQRNQLTVNNVLTFAVAIGRTDFFKDLESGRNKRKRFAPLLYFQHIGSFGNGFCNRLKAWIAL